MLHFECPSCKSKLQAADDFAGKSIVCPTCQQSATVPQGSAAITAAPVVSLPSIPPMSAVTTPELAQAAQYAKAGWRPDDEDRDQDRLSISLTSTSWLRLGVYGLIGASVLAVLLALLLPATQKVREASARTQSINNLKQIGLAFQSFHDTYKRLPFNGSDIAVKDSKYSAAAQWSNAQSGSWAFHIMPYIDQTPIFSGDLRGIGQEHLPKPTNEEVRAVGVHCYMCPGRGRPIAETSNGGGAWTDYFINNYVNSTNYASKPDNADSRRTLVSITDGTSNTVFVGHGNISTSQYQQAANVALSVNMYVGGTAGTMRSGDDGSTAPTGVKLQPDSAAMPGVGSWGGPFPQGALMVMGDGSVRVFPYATQNFGAFLTPEGNEDAVLPD